jgi:hypothetical protein
MSTPVNPGHRIPDIGKNNILHSLEDNCTTSASLRTIS